MDPNSTNLYAGLSDIVLIPEKFELGQGVVISRTYAHFMAPFLMAFSHAPAGKPHPAPWKTAKGGFSIDIAAELFVPVECHLDHLDRFNTIWWIAALLRLKATALLYIPVVSSERFSSIPAIAEEPEIWPVEIHTHRILPEKELQPLISEVQLTWLRDTWQEASKLLA